MALIVPIFVKTARCESIPKKDYAMVEQPKINIEQILGSKFHPSK